MPSPNHLKSACRPRPFWHNQNVLLASLMPQFWIISVEEHARGW